MNNCPFSYPEGEEPAPIIHQVIGECACGKPAYTLDIREVFACWECAYDSAN